MLTGRVSGAIVAKDNEVTSVKQRVSDAKGSVARVPIDLTKRRELQEDIEDAIETPQKSVVH